MQDRASAGTLSRRALLGRGAALALPALMGVGCASTTGHGRRNAVAPVPPPVAGPYPIASWYPAPDLSDAAVLRYDAGVRPYRRGSYRLEAEHAGGRVLMHNYGHGGSGWTLSWGCAEWIAQEAGAIPQEPGGPREAAVLGAGVIGLTTALALAERGWGVTVYAERVGTDTTSVKAGAQFAPSLIATPRGPAAAARLDQLVRVSHGRFVRDLDEAQGVQRRINFAAERGGYALSNLPKDLSAAEHLDRLPIDGLDEPGEAYRTLLIEPPRYLPVLAGRLRERGVAFVTRRFERVEQVHTLAHRLTVNCLGLGAGVVFADDAVVPIRGQLVHLRPQPLGYMISHRGYLFARSDAVVLGGTVERGVDVAVPEQAACQEILEAHRRFFGTGATPDPRAKAHPAALRYA